MAPTATTVTDGVGVAHLPNQRHKIVSKRGANFTLMVCGKNRKIDQYHRAGLCLNYIIAGESGVGKTTFVNTLFTTSIKEPKQLSKRHNKQVEKTVEIEITKAGKQA